MGINSLPMISAELIAHGREAGTPAAIIRNGTRCDQQVLRGTLASLPELVAKNNIKPPALIVLGKVVNQFNAANIGEFGYLKSLVAPQQKKAV